MHLVSRSSCFRIRPPYYARALRGISTSERASQDASLGDRPAQTNNVTKTRRKYSELPSRLLNEDGSPAAPLPPWSGGLSVLTVSEPTPEPEVVKKTRRPRKKLPESSAEASPDAVQKPRRGRKAKATVEQTVEDEQLIPLPNTPLAADITGNLSRFPHCVLLTRVGQFYESYFDQAVEVAKLLHIKLTTKSWGGRRVHMCGFPLMHLNKYLKVLVSQHKRFVAICEEFPRDPYIGPKAGFNRRVTRIVTPGTLIDEPFLNPYENNYLLAVSDCSDDVTNSNKPRAVGLAWIDVSTGDFFTNSTNLDGLRDELVRISPKELVLDSSLKEDASHPIRRTLEDEDFFLSYATPDGSVQAPDLTSQVAEDDVVLQLDLPSTDTSISTAEASAVQLLTTFMRANLLEHMPQLGNPSKEAIAGRMQIDSHTVKALEIRESMREGGVTGSLLSVIKRTVTTGGTRLLARWICSPSTSVAEINTRQSLVGFFKSRPYLRTDLVQALNDMSDTSRIIQKFLLGRGDASDLLALGGTIDAWDAVQRRIELERTVEQQSSSATLSEDWASLNALLSRMADLQPLVHKIHAALVQDSNTSEVPLSDGNEEFNESSSTEPLATTSTYDWKIKPEFSKQLTELHATLTDLNARREQLEKELQMTYNTPSLTLRSSPAQGMHVHIAKAKRDRDRIKADPRFVSVTDTATTSTFFLQEWSQLGGRIIETTTAISLAEKEAFEILRGQVIAHEHDLRKNARIMDELDVVLAFANLAEELNFVRPIIKEDTSYHVVNGRHPTVELGLLTSGRVFTPNTVSFTPEDSIHIITGPNMAGKSTLLRQTALITILAQTGSFVPADHAEIGIVDKVFSRVGAKDDLFRDRSTFMVEMLETAEILRRATPRSLVIMDEVGRGTTVDDGLAIAFATIHHLITVNGCRSLFATHFHELADMLGYSATQHQGEGVFGGVRFFCTGVDETEDGYFAYSHRLKPGVNRDSHGLKVAQLAGMPPPAIHVAQNAISWFKTHRDVGHRSKDQLHSLGQTLAMTSP
ncbi:hypothetical protein K474DRAFT_1655535 [Panus rudis PR-1116 ss-1]|nr:hypothetical protein K474DRAFT_1655535 [Panus rudis PR-1116 ss-1]